MFNFKSTKIIPLNEQIAEELINARKERNVSLHQAAKKLNINIKYLQALESGKFYKLPPGVYSKNFLKEYALFLKLDSKALIKLFDNETRNKHHQIQENLFSTKVVKKYDFIAAPKIIKIILILSIVGIIVIYLGISINNIISPPALIITNPQTDTSTDKHNIVIQGKTDIEAQIEINNINIITNTDGSFKKDISLKMGLNNIKIIAQKKYSKKNIILRKILVK